MDFSFACNSNIQLDPPDHHRDMSASERVLR